MEEETVISDFTIENLRHISHLNISPLARVSLVGGKNGVGKTTLLEAIWLFTGPNYPSLTARVGQFRGFVDPRNELFFANLFPHFQTDRAIKLRATRNGREEPSELTITVSKNNVVLNQIDPKEGSNRLQSVGEHQVVFTYQEEKASKPYVSSARWVREAPTSVVPGRVQVAGEGTHEVRAPMPTRPGAILMTAKNREDAASVASRLGELQLAEKDDSVLHLLRHLEPKLNRLSTITIENDPLVYAHIGSEPPLPASLVGEGFNRLLELAVGMGHMSGGMLLIDEIENGLHHSALEEIFSALYALALQFDVQVIATTHSAECIRAAHAALADFGEDGFAYHRIDRHDDGLKTVHFDREMTDTAIDYGLEVR